MSDFEKKSKKYVARVIACVVLLVLIVFPGKLFLSNEVVALGFLLIIVTFIGSAVKACNAIDKQIIVDAEKQATDIKTQNRAWFDKCKAELEEAPESDYRKRALHMCEVIENKFDEVNTYEIGTLIATLRFVVLNKNTGEDYGE